MSGILGYIMPLEEGFITFFFFFKAKMIPVGCSREITRAVFQSRRFYGIGTAPYGLCCLLSGAKLVLQDVYLGLHSCT